ncbi:MAG: lysylphosphatidylglycerol synthase domain-containing protein [Microvirga sp.]|nr:lysylphosphatidylglycerol synthase domain-containing protein [Microvirga sp.]
MADEETDGKRQGRGLFARLKEHVWAIVGVVAVIVSVWLLYHEVNNISLDDIVDGLQAITPLNWMLAAGATILAYAALAGYDKIALRHLGKDVAWPFVALCSFTTYALAHNIGASVVSGAVVRYRAYTTKGLTGADVAMLVALCSFTFVLGTVLLAGIVLLIEPELVARFFEDAPNWVGVTTGVVILALVSAYVFGSWMGLRPARFGKYEIRYPRLPVVWRQLLIGPLELIGAGAIIYFALPQAGNPGFIVILGLFLASFSAALLSHAPGGIGVLELVFITGLPDMDPADVLAALIVFRGFYLLIPFALSLVVIGVFERSQYLRRKTGLETGCKPGPGD